MLSRATVADAETRLSASGFAAADVRSLTLLFTQYVHALGRRTKLRQRVVSTACVFFQRFFVVRTFLEHDPLLVAATAVWMASKVEESAVSPKHLVAMMHELGLPGNPYEAKHLVAAEYVLLDVLAPFGLGVTHPHESLARLLASCDLRAHVGESKSDSLVQTATVLVNDACRTPDLALCAAPRIVALSCAHTAALLEHVDLRSLLPEPTADEHAAIEACAASLHALFESLHAGDRSACAVGANAAAQREYSRETFSSAHARLYEHWALEWANSGLAVKDHDGVVS
jgi:hypothetical protein